jgi:hypothetical protein
MLIMSYQGGGYLTVAEKASALIAEILIVLIKKINMEPYTDLVS